MDDHQFIGLVVKILGNIRHFKRSNNDGTEYKNIRISAKSFAQEADSVTSLTSQFE